MKRHLCTLFAIALPALCIAAVPLKWTVETSRVQPVVFDVVRGETLDLTAAFQSYGKPLNLTGTFKLYYQTNGMDTAWWQGAASVSSNTVTATWTPAMDPGAAAVYGFLGASGETYRAAFTLRFRHGPGANPDMVAPPVQTLDFAHITVLNPPWSSGGGGGGTDGAAVTNIVTGIVSDYLPLDGGTIHGNIYLRDGWEYRFEGDDNNGSFSGGSLVLGDSMDYVCFNFDSANITFHDDEGEERTTYFNYPKRDGTLALTSDIITPDYTTNNAELVSTITNTVPVVREVQLYDATKGVTWKFVMDDGHLYTVAVTNVDITAGN